MIAFGGFHELRESSRMLAPVEFAAINNYPSNGSTVTTDPLGCAVYDNVGSMVKGTSKISARSKGIIHLGENC